MVCVISETTVCLCIHPHCRFLHVLELEDGEDVCRLEVGGGEGGGGRGVGNAVEESHLIRCTQVCMQSKHIAAVCSSVWPP